MAGTNHVASDCGNRWHTGNRLPEPHHTSKHQQVIITQDLDLLRQAIRFKKKQFSTRNLSLTNSEAPKF